MLTREKEKDRNDNLAIKAHKYWPEVNESMFYDNLIVSHTKQTQDKQLIIREFTVKSAASSNNSSNNSNRAKQLIMLHYIAWPDFGAPTEFDSFTKLFTKYRNYKSQCNQSNNCSDQKSNDKLTGNSSTAYPPILVHCSAGIGRTGTFIAIDLILDYILHCQQNNVDCSISVFSVVHSLRLCRSGMVQTKQQYEFITHFLAHAINNKLFGLK
jgi:protein tyrosine phosphatase